MVLKEDTLLVFLIIYFNTRTSYINSEKKLFKFVRSECLDFSFYLLLFVMLCLHGLNVVCGDDFYIIVRDEVTFDQMD